MIISGIIGVYEAIPAILGGISAISAGIASISHTGESLPPSHNGSYYEPSAFEEESKEVR
jgi:hypothetical protein